MATTAQRNKAVVRRFVDAWNEADLAVIDEIVAPDAEHHDPMDPPDLRPGPAGEKQLIEIYQSAFPDATLEIEDMLAEGDRVATRWTAAGTHEGEFMGVEPTGNEVRSKASRSIDWRTAKSSSRGSSSMPLVCCNRSALCPAISETKPDAVEKAWRYLLSLKHGLPSGIDSWRRISRVSDGSAECSQ